MNLDRKMLGQRIKYYRKRHNLTQQSLADIVGLSREFITKIESGSERIGLEALLDIAAALNTSIDDLVTDSIKKSSNGAISDFQKILLDCSKNEEEIIIRNATELKKILYSLGI